MRSVAYKMTDVFVWVVLFSFTAFLLKQILETLKTSHE